MTQLSAGYFANAHLKIFLGYVMSRLGLKLYGGDAVSRFSMNLEMRIHDYSGFKERELAISGRSFGLGFTYDFL